MPDIPSPAVSARARGAAALAAAIPTYLHAADLQGLAQLATDATLGVTRLAETVQGNVYKTVAAPLGAAGARFVDRSEGASGIRPRSITGFVYGAVRGVTRLAGATADAALSAVAARSERRPSSPKREAVLAALGGVLGDRLRETGNPLEIRMSLRHEGNPLPLDPAGLAKALPQCSGKILVLLHGLCMNDLQWRPAEGASHGDLLAAELGYTPIYLHYNTGLRTSDNGAQLAGLLEQLVQAWPAEVQEVSLLAHSMGGLVARSACEHARVQGLHWRPALRHIVFLGTPHHGAPLERLGGWLDRLLGSNPVTRPFARIGKVRSAGITDLREGHVLEADWKKTADATDKDEAAPVPGLALPEDVACFAIAAMLGEASGAASPAQSLARRWLGDGLVPLESALGQHEDPRRSLAFREDRTWVVPNTDHLALLTRAEVAQKVVGWLRPAMGQGTLPVGDNPAR